MAFDILHDRPITFNILQERPISFNEAAKLLLTDSRPSDSTWWRWFSTGIRGVKLETALIGGRRVTSAEAVARFIAAVTAAADGGPTQLRSPEQRERAIRAAEKELERAGIRGREKDGAQSDNSTQARPADQSAPAPAR